MILNLFYFVSWDKSCKQTSSQIIRFRLSSIDVQSDLTPIQTAFPQAELPNDIWPITILIPCPKFLSTIAKDYLLNCCLMPFCKPVIIIDSRVLHLQDAVLNMLPQIQHDVSKTCCTAHCFSRDSLMRCTLGTSPWQEVPVHIKYNKVYRFSG